MRVVGRAWKIIIILISDGFWGSTQIMNEIFKVLYRQASGFVAWTVVVVFELLKWISFSTFSSSLNVQVPLGNMGERECDGFIHSKRVKENVNKITNPVAHFLWENFVNKSLNSFTRMSINSPDSFIIQAAFILNC
jgi:hypothetical protein